MDNREFENIEGEKYMSFELVFSFVDFEDVLICLICVEVLGFWFWL